MRKLKRIKIRHFKASEIKEKYLSEEELQEKLKNKERIGFSDEENKEREIAIDENFLLQNLFAHRNINIENIKNDTLSERVIKVSLESNYKEAKKTLENGVYLYDEARKRILHYIPLVTSPSLIKAERIKPFDLDNN